MSIDRYDPIRVLGEGSFGKVYLMRDKVKRNFVCVKIIKIKNIPKKEREATKLEVDLLKRLNHPNIVGYVDSFLSKNQESLCICMEYCDGGDLASQIKAAKRNLFSESKILHWFVQLALGLHYMHGNRILHRDLKTQNVFLLGNGRLVLGDLGISKVLDGTMDFAQTCIGTPYYMSPEIFKNKPYSYKSDIWALGCILYELTTLNHAFDANSLNGLATKIVKGKYPPISNKYSKHLKDLITQMLMLNPQQRPDVDQILRKPFIKKHIVNFFVDIYSRPSTSIGEGTMILKAAAGGPSGGGGSVMNDQSMINFRNQLQQLDMMDMVQEALRPKEKPQDDQEAIRQAKEQASALKREQEHKKMVEAALEKLRQERELRARQRGGAAPVGASGVPGGRVAAGGGGGAGSNGSAAAAAAAGGGRAAGAGRVNPSPSNANAPPSSNRISNRDAKETPSPANINNNNNNNVRDRGFNWDQRPIRGGAAAGGAGGANEYLPPPRYDDVSGGAAHAAGRRRSTFEDQNKPAAAAAAVSDRERDRVERDRRAAEERRRLLLIQEQETQAAAAAKQRVEDQRRREEAKAASDAALARARAEAEAERQRLEAAREKAEQATRARRDVQREKERERQRLEIEQLKKDKLELDRRTQERDKMREDRRVQEVARMDAVRREQMDVMQEKLDFMNNQLNKLEIPSRRALAGGAGAGGVGYVPSMAEEKNSDLSARERAYFRRGDNKLAAAAAKDEYYETADNNSNYSDENAIGRRSRLAAQQQQQMKESGSNVSMGSNNSNNSSNNNNNNNYVGRNRSQFSSDPAPQVLPGEFSPPPANHRAQAANYEYDANAQRSSRRLRDLSSDDTPASSNNNNNNNNNNYKMGGGGLLAGHGSDSDEDDLFVAKKNALMPSNADDEEEDLVRREEELRAELNFATMRCEELKRTLQETKSFLGPRLPTRGKIAGQAAAAGPLGSAMGGVRPMAPPASAAALGMAVGGGGGGIAAVNDNEEDEDLDDDDDFLTEDEYDDDFEEGANNNSGARNNNNNNNNRGPKSSFSIQTDFDDDDNGSNNNNNPDRTLPRLRPPVSAVPSSAYGGLQDMPSPSGKLSDRIERLRQRCKEALGERTFWEAYNFLKQHEQESQGYDNGRDLNDDDYEARKMARVRAILGERKEHYVSLIDQLIFMEDAEHD